MIRRTWAISFVIAFSSAAQDAPYQWARTGSLITARHSACAVPLEDGRVLVTGGVSAAGVTPTAELYVEDSFRPAAPMQFPRSRHTCTLLPDGRVLVAGGDNVAAAELYDPREDRWVAVEGLIHPRAGHTASLLPDGSVLLAGGETAAGPTDLLERYDPATESIAALAVSLSVPRARHAAAVLADGRVLIAGGTMDGKEPLATAELFDPVSSAVFPAALMPAPRANLTATTLLDGRVLVAGGGEAGTLFYEPEADVFRDGPKLNVPRTGLVALRLPNNGNVLLAGGSSLSDGEPSAATELLDVTKDEIERVGDLTVARTGIAVAPAGRTNVLAIGGERDNAPFAGCGTLIIAAVTPNKTFYVEGEQARLNINWNQRETLTVNVRKRVNGSLTTELVTRQSVSTLTDPLFILTPALEGNAEVTAVVTGDRTGTTATTTFLVGTAVTTVITRSPSPSLARDAVTIQVQMTGANPCGARRPERSRFWIRKPGSR